MPERDVDAVTRGSVDDPGRAIKSLIRDRGVHGSIARFCRADPALFMFGRYHGKVMSCQTKSMDEFVKKHALYAVIIGDQKIHLVMAPRRFTGCKRE